MSIAEQVAARRRGKGLSQAELAALAGVSQQLVSQIERGENDTTKHLPSIARALECTVADLDDSYRDLGPSEMHVVAPSEDDMVDVYNVEASAGFGSLVGHEMVVDRLSFPPGYLRQITSSHPSNLAIISVKGDSMQTTLADGDLVMVDTSKRDLSFDGLFVLQDGGASLLVKRVGRAARRGWVKLISDNKVYDAIEREVSEIDVVGKVIWKGVKE